MRCKHCSKRSGVYLSCEQCGKNLCTNCIQLEIHNCDGYLNKIDELKRNLKDSTPLIRKDKVPYRLE